jgi:hypothetical protein
MGGDLVGRWVAHRLALRLTPSWVPFLYLIVRYQKESMVNHGGAFLF